MRKAFFIENEKFEVQEAPIPEPEAGELLIQNKACGVCGTDIHIYHGEPGSADVTPPVVLGHEYAGIIQKVGEGVSGFQVGDHVTIDPNIYCGVCRYCRDGKKQMCENMKAIGVTQDGGFAEYSIIPASQAFLLPSELDLEMGAMAEPLACCIHGIDQAQIKTGDTVVIIGGGAIGLLLLQLARLSGASQVILSEPVELRQEIAKKLGADATFDPMKKDPAEEVKKLTGKDGADVVIECVGKTVATKQAFEMAAKGATILLFSVPSVDATFDLPLFDVFKKELVIKGSFVNPDTHARAVDLLRSGKIQIVPLITHRFGLDEMDQAIKMQMSAQSIKVLVKP
jgi:2-desacetyl-2-hydroxyethyl bacteriochlorophyllide A dehydrogenase